MQRKWKQKLGAFCSIVQTSTMFEITETTEHGRFLFAKRLTCALIILKIQYVCVGVEFTVPGFGVEYWE